MTMLPIQGNALKFHPDEKAMRKLSVAATDQGETWLLEIKDNGIGIDEKYHEDVFRLFKRLEPSKYPGAGLTLARKIVRQHGGEIWIKSEPGQGTNVPFTLEKR